MLGRGLFALRPLGYNAEMTELKVEFHWMACQGHNINDSIPITKIPASSAGLNSTTDNQGGKYQIGYKEDSGEYRDI